MDVRTSRTDLIIEKLRFEKGKQIFKIIQGTFGICVLNRYRVIKGLLKSDISMV